MHFLPKQRLQILRRQLRNERNFKIMDSSAFIRRIIPGVELMFHCAPFNGERSPE
jgi:hypothetical protein